MMYCATSENLERLDRVFKNPAQKIVSLTSYEAREASIVSPLVDFILVGDSVAMVRHGHGTTQEATMEMMKHHGKIVVEAAKFYTPVVVDMPECEYRTKPIPYVVEMAKNLAFHTRCAALKIEAGADQAAMIKAVVDAGVPVMGHIGMMPSKYAAGQMPKIEGRTEESAEKVRADARAIKKAGAFALVVEGVFEPVAGELTRANYGYSTIGIGASPDCDGQILVLDDMMGWHSGRRPRFAEVFMGKQVMPLNYYDRANIRKTVISYATSVKSGKFPHRELHCYGATFVAEQQARRAAKEVPVYGG